jgi:aromatic-L-amino-acid decarboxylase
MLGLGKKSLVKIPTNNRYEMDVENLREAVQDDRSAGYLPFCVVPTIGTTSSSSADDVDRIADICERNNLWLHVDTAYAGATAIVPEFQNTSKVANAPIQS